MHALIVTQKPELVVFADDANIDVIVAIIERLARSREFLPKVMEAGFQKLLALNPSFAAIERACKAASGWYVQYGPDESWGWFDQEEFSTEHSDKCYALWQSMSERLVESITDFYSALEVARHCHPRTRHDALDKVRDFAQMPEHLLDWVKVKADIQCGFSFNDHIRFVEVTTVFNLNICIDWQNGTSNPEYMPTLVRELENCTFGR